MSPPRPVFSIVSAVHDVETYLPAFISSIETQDFGTDGVEVIVVDDGSTDGSRAVLDAWAARGTAAVTVLHQANRGQAAARNAGLRVASGEWVTFTDPDDMLDPRFLGTVHRYAARHRGIDLIGTLPVLFDERHGRVRPVHPRTAQFENGNRVVDLDLEPNVFPGSATVSLFRLDRVRAAGLEFDEALRPIFEDQHFTARFLLAQERPVAALVRSARYMYRKRLSSDSTMQRSFDLRGRYTTVLERGYLDLLRRARRLDGTVAAWVQHLVIYDLSKLFREHDKPSTRLAIPEELLPRFHELLEAIIHELEPEVVYAHTGSRLTPAMADLLAHAFPATAWRPSIAARTRVDRAMGLQRIVYRYAGPSPVEEVTVDGIGMAPAWSKRRPIAYFGRTFLDERILWVPAAGAALRLDGTRVTIEPPWTQSTAPVPDRPSRGSSGLERLRWRVARWGQQARRDAERWLARTVYRRRFRDAWVLMDRIDMADDNGERLFEHLRMERRDVNAWFVLREGVPDWHRMRAAGTDRLVAHGSFTWRMLMLNASWLLASDAYAAIVRPKAILELVQQVPWAFGFLQHGVTKDDLSPWLNRIEMDLFLVSTKAELASVVDDGTGYSVTGKETRLTGLPRFDRLLRKGKEVPPEEVRMVIVAPTWRSWLTMPLAAGSSRRKLRAEFWESEYMTRWMAVLGSPAIAAAVVARGWRLAFMPHPNLQQALARIDLPGHVEALAYAGQDVQALHARCALLVTDYSSLAFNIAYLERPVVYYQFDRGEIEEGRHVGRRGYFEYERDGFGPVAVDHDAAVAAIVASIERGPTPTTAYLERIARAFPTRDGGACARVVAAVEELSRPWEPPA